jgi:hypothetical protein
MNTKLLIAVAVFSAILLPAKPSVAQDAASANAFLNSTFQLYDKGGHGAPYTGTYFHSSLLTLLRADLKAAAAINDGPPVAGSDPICGCQEWDGIWVLKMNLKMETPQRAQAVISFAIYAPKDRPSDDLRIYKFTLVPEHGQWRIYDILYMSDPVSEPSAPKNLRKQLQEEINNYAHLPKP